MLLIGFSSKKNKCICVSPPELPLLNAIGADLELQAFFGATTNFLNGAEILEGWTTNFLNWSWNFRTLLWEGVYSSGGWGIPLVGKGDKWCRMMNSGGWWWRLVGKGDKWCRMMTRGRWWWRLVGKGDKWCRMMTSGGWWWRLVGKGDKWCRMMKSGGGWWRLVEIESHYVNYHAYGQLTKVFSETSY